MRADSNKSMALAWPTIRGSIQLRPCSAIRPRLENAVVKTALSAANRMSQYKACTKPMPAVAPLSMPITGLGIAG